jgi:glycosyltransferase involved in cell wall biosynthesis
MISIIIPTFNNLDYLKICINSIRKNSSYDNEIILHINEGTDGTLQYAKDNKIKYSYSEVNSGLCVGCNLAAKKTSHDLILYAHDDMYFCPNWDNVLIEEVKKLNTNKFYLSSIMINADPKLNGFLNFNAGENNKDFDEEKLLSNYKDLTYFDFQGSTWAPHLIHKEIWESVGGFSEEFSPGAGSDPDLNMKMWQAGVRIFKGLGNSKVYHFGSITIRKKNIPEFKKNIGSRANKKFLMKWGISIGFFKKYYLKSDTFYLGPLEEPKKNINYFINLIKIKISYFYYYIFSKY